MTHRYLVVYMTRRHSVVGYDAWHWVVEYDVWHGCLGLYAFMWLMSALRSCV